MELQSSDRKIKLIEVLKIVETWCLDDKITFFEKIVESIPIEIRFILQRDELSELQKIKALELINEFHHEMNKIRRSLSLIVGAKFRIYEIYNYIKFMATQNDKLISSEIAYCVNSAFKITSQKLPKKNEYPDLNPSIHELFRDKKFDNEIGDIIGAENLDNLEGFILGYFYAINSNEIIMHGTRGLPNLNEIKDWIKDGGVTENWKKELEKHYKEDAVKEFLKRYRDNIIEYD